jgi:hypothetical protein
MIDFIPPPSNRFYKDAIDLVLILYLGNAYSFETFLASIYDHLYQMNNCSQDTHILIQSELMNIVYGYKEEIW